MDTPKTKGLCTFRPCFVHGFFMDRVRFIVAALLLGLLPAVAFAAEDGSQKAGCQIGRQTELFNFGWSFHPGDVQGAEQPGFDDSRWRTLDLPHDMQIEQPWVKEAPIARGYKEMIDGWYRKSFSYRPEWDGKRVILDFEGIMWWSDVWVNGKHVGGDGYGFLGYEVDITDALDKDGENVVAVKAWAGKDDGSRWYVGAGIYRDVHLTVKNHIAIARHGVYVYTPTVGKDFSEVQVQVEIEGDMQKRIGAEINVDIVDPQGVKVAQAKTVVGPDKLLRPELKLPLITVENPQLWSCETPNLYKAEVTLTQNGELLGNVTETFGIRSIEFSPEFGFKLNGEKLFLKGTGGHLQDNGALGVAAFDAYAEQKMITLKKFGFNHIRCAHNPYSEAFYDLADKYGIIIVDEFGDKWGDEAYWGGHEPFSHIWFDIMKEWVKRSRNHPSIVLWSLGNELQMFEELCGFPTSDWGVTTYRIFDTYVKRFDDTRKTTVGIFPSHAGAIQLHEPGFNTNVVAPELAVASEVASFNYRYEDYEEYRKHNPELIIYQSEATMNELTAPYYGMDHDSTVGMAYWGAVEYWGETWDWPKKGWNHSIFNHSMDPYPQAWLIRSAFMEDEPLVRIGVFENKEQYEFWDNVVGHLDVSENWNREEGSVANLYTYTNADEVELFLNGRSLGVKKNPREELARINIIQWPDVAYEPGRLLAVARTGGREVARHAVETAGKPVGFEVVVENPDGWRADGMDLVFVKVYAVDRKGNRVPYASDMVSFEVEGDARIIAVDDADHFTDKTFEGSSRNMHKGFVMAILRAGRTGGEVNVAVSADGYRKSVLNLNMELPMYK